MPLSGERLQALLGRDNESNIAEISLSVREKILLTTFNKLDDADQKLLLSLIERLAFAKQNPMR